MSDEEQQTTAAVVSLTPEAFKTVKQVADSDKRRVEDVISEAIALEKLLSDVRRSGGRLAVVERNGRVNPITRVP